jgi:hypothetical protein
MLVCARKNSVRKAGATAADIAKFAEGISGKWRADVIRRPSAIPPATADGICNVRGAWTMRM